MSFSFSTSGTFSKTSARLEKLRRLDILSVLEAHGQAGVTALSMATIEDTGESAQSWTYEVRMRNGNWSIVWKNTHMAGTTPVVILLQYGHGTGTGGYVQGRDFINPAIKPIFQQIARDVRKVVTSR